MAMDELVQCYQRHKRGECSWVDLSKIYLKYVKEGSFIPPEIQTMGDRLTKAHNFIVSEGFEKDPRIHGTKLYVAQYMPYIKRLMVETPDRYKKLVEDVINGKITSKDIENISKELRGKDLIKKTVIGEGNLPPVVVEQLEGLVAALTKSFENLQAYYPDLRNKMGPACDYLSQLLQGVADEEYYKMWKERKEIQI